MVAVAVVPTSSVSKFCGSTEATELPQTEAHGMGGVDEPTESEVSFVETTGSTAGAFELGRTVDGLVTSKS